VCGGIYIEVPCSTELDWRAIFLIEGGTVANSRVNKKNFVRKTSRKIGTKISTTRHRKKSL